MSNTTVIRDISMALSALIEKKLKDANINLSVSLKSPGDLMANANSANQLSLFLLHINFNPDQRNKPIEKFWLVDKDSNSNQEVDVAKLDVKKLSQKQQVIQETLRPAVLDLCYLITPFSPSSQETEIIVLESIIQFFHENGILTLKDFSSTLDARLIQSLENQGNDQIYITPKNINLDLLYKLWNMFPGKSYRQSLLYLVSGVTVLPQKTHSLFTVKSRKNIVVHKK